MLAVTVPRHREGDRPGTVFPGHRDPGSTPAAKGRLPPAIGRGLKRSQAIGKIGAGGGNRTPDIQLGKLTFYL